jgi:phosphoglycerol geranylgeranyltransferase
MYSWKDWYHVTKVDPGRSLGSLKASFEDIVNSGTDAIWISGTQNITYKKVKKFFKLLAKYDIPLVEELPDHRLFVYDPRIDWYFIPSVLNTNNAKWVCGKHKDWLKDDYEKMDKSKIVKEVYLILNLDSAVAKLTGAFHVPDEDVIGYARYAQLYNYSLFYIEGSGKYIRELRGNTKIISLARDTLDIPIAYGGGIKGENSKEMAREIIKILRKNGKKGFVVV